MTPTSKPLIGFARKDVHLVRIVKLAVTLGKKGKDRSLRDDFLVVDVPLPYYIIMGWPTLNKVKAAISVYQLPMQYETGNGEVGKGYGDQQRAREC